MTSKYLLGALVLGSVLALAGSPASAAPPPPPNITFGIQIGPGDPPPPDFEDDCLSTKAIFAELRYAGYRNLTNYDDSEEDTFFIDARRGTKWYELEVDSCSGDLISRTRIKYPD